MAPSQPESAVPVRDLAETTPEARRTGFPGVSLKLKLSLADGHVVYVSTTQGRYVVVGLDDGTTMCMHPTEAGILGDALTSSAKELGRQGTPCEVVGCSGLDPSIKAANQSARCPEHRR